MNMEATTYRGGVRNRRIRALARLQKNYEDLKTSIDNKPLNENLEKFKKEYFTLKKDKKADQKKLEALSNKIKILESEKQKEEILFVEQRKRLEKMEKEMATLKSRI